MKSNRLLIYHHNTLIHLDLEQTYQICLFVAHYWLCKDIIHIIMVSRLLYGMSRNEWIPETFSHVNKYTNTPIFSTIFTSIIILIFALWLPILTLAGLTSFLIFIIFIVMNLSLIRIKQKDAHPIGITSYPMWIPILGIILNIMLLSIQIFYFLVN